MSNDSGVDGQVLCQGTHHHKKVSPGNRQLIDQRGNNCTEGYLTPGTSSSEGKVPLLNPGVLVLVRAHNHLQVRTTDLMAIHKETRT